MKQSVCMMIVGMLSIVSVFSSDYLKENYPEYYNMAIKESEVTFTKNGFPCSVWENVTTGDVNAYTEKLEFSLLPKEYGDIYFPLLDQKYYHILTNDEYEDITGKKLTKKYALAIRGISPTWGPVFSVSRDKKGNIRVSHGTLMQSDPDSLNKAILLIQVDDLPDNIGVSFHIAG